jgi:hypothetical protein
MTNPLRGRPDDGSPPFPRLAALVKKAIPWSAGASFVVAIILTATAGVPEPPPGIAFHSKGLYIVERGAVIFAALIIGFGLLGRALRGELPSGFATTGVTYSERSGPRSWPVSAPPCRARGWPGS